MVEVGLGLLIASFTAGIFMFLAPCTLPLVPAYLAFIGGVKQSDLSDPDRAKFAHNKIVVNGLYFVLGFSVIFILLGVLVGFLGSQTIGPFRQFLVPVGGWFIILFGLLMLNVIKIPTLMKEHKLNFAKHIEPGTKSAALILGATFSLGWSPCIGPILASVLLVATESVTQGAIFLTAFSLGLALPLMLTAILYSRMTGVLNVAVRFSKYMSVIGGVFLIFIGVLMVVDKFGLMVQYGYVVFEIFGFDGLFDKL
ncbi:sulfite exporter TauE/SafE family protein [Candidatus Kaiserbacteria bacterium]|nr:sulfite exporter TauE/SafE family protein [Candidatus Kaiserbacteria bacterium]